LPEPPCGGPDKKAKEEAMDRINDLPGWIAAVAAQPRVLALVAIVAAAAFYDARTHRIPNVLTFGGALAGLLLAAAGLGAGPSLLNALAGALLGLALMLPMYIVGALGAADVKLMTAVGAFLGAPDIVFALLLTWFVGGIAAVAYSARQRNLTQMLLNARDLAQLMALAAAHGQRPQVSTLESVGKLPYGVCICIGTVAWVALAQWRA
jgi:prepilin peptidase CpaA